MTDVYGWYRVGHVLSEHGVPVLPAVMTLVVRLLFGCYIPHQARIGRGTNFAYGGVGVVVHRDCIIGRDCSIAPGVVLGGGRGGRGPRGTSVPVLGDGVVVGAGAKVLGPVAVGDRSIIGANAVVTRDVAAGSTVAGIPARPLEVTRADRDVMPTRLDQGCAT